MLPFPRFPVAVRASAGRENDKAELFAHYPVGVTHRNTTVFFNQTLCVQVAVKCDNVAVAMAFLCLRAAAPTSCSCPPYR